MALSLLSSYFHNTGLTTVILETFSGRRFYSHKYPWRLSFTTHYLGGVCSNALQLSTLNYSYNYLSLHFRLGLSSALPALKVKNLMSDCTYSFSGYPLLDKLLSSLLLIYATYCRISTSGRYTDPSNSYIASIVLWR